MTQMSSMSAEIIEANELKTFGKPLNKELTEMKTVKVRTPIIDTSSGRVTGFEESEKEVPEKVIYAQAKLTGTFCRDEDHEYHTIEETPGGYAAKCSKCNHGKFVNPLIHTIKDGKIFFRKAQNGKISN